MASSALTAGGEPRIRTIGPEAPWQWLAAGWRDLWRRPDVGLLYGLGIAVAGYLLALTLYYFDALVVFLPLLDGFALVGPILAVGLYETSRRLEAGEPVRAGDVILVRVRSPGQLAFIGVILMLAALAWVRLATLIFALFFGPSVPPLGELFESLFLSFDGVVFLAVGTVVGACLAFAVFAISAISVPLLLDRDVDAVTAVLTSIEAVRRNFWPMLLWAWLIALFTTIGLVTLLVGLIVTFPLIGHATWHAYRALVEEEE